MTAGTFFLMGGDAAGGPGPSRGAAVAVRSRAGLRSLGQMAWPATNPQGKSRSTQVRNRCARPSRLRDDGQRHRPRCATSASGPRLCPGGPDRSGAGLPWTRRWPGWTRPVCGASKRKRTVCAGSCCWLAGPRGRNPRTLPSVPPPRRVSAARSPWPGSRRLDGGSCVPRSACAGCLRNGTDHKMRAEPKLTRCWLRFTAGSARGSKCRTCARRRALLQEVSQGQLVAAAGS